MLSHQEDYFSAATFKEKEINKRREARAQKDRKKKNLTSKVSI